MIQAKEASDEESGASFFGFLRNGVRTGNFSGAIEQSDNLQYNFR